MGAHEEQDGWLACEALTSFRPNVAGEMLDVCAAGCNPTGPHLRLGATSAPEEVASASRSSPTLGGTHVLAAASRRARSVARLWRRRAAPGRQHPSAEHPFTIADLLGQGGRRFIVLQMHMWGEVASAMRSR